MQAHVCVEHFVDVAGISLQVHAFFTRPLFSGLEFLKTLGF
jgi:hypothetical protein